MTRVLLLGAGFSRNWGGWLASEAFEYLLGCPEVAARPLLRDMLWQCQGKGGFEAALGPVTAANTLNEDPIPPHPAPRR